MSDLTDFLLARIAEDEAGRLIDGAHESWCMDRLERLAPDGKCFYCGHLPDPSMAERVPPSARVLAECEAKRRIVDLHNDDSPGLCDELLALASVYADHPDFREEWRA